MLPHSLLALPPLVGRSGVLDGGLAREHRAHRERVSRLKGSRIGWIAEDQGRLRTARLNVVVVKSLPPTTASTCPVSASMATSAA